MRKLNNKGMTAVEVLVCFVLLVIIVVSMYTTVSAYKNKQSIESFKEKIFTYKNLLTKDIQDDLIKTGLISVNIVQASSTSELFVVDMMLRDGTTKRLKIVRELASDYDDPVDPAEDQDDNFMISYGSVVNGTEDLIDYPIPDLGYGENANGRKVYDFRINNVDINTDNGILTLYIGFYHPDFGTKYAIDIICPINAAL